MNLRMLIILFLFLSPGAGAQWREDFSLEPFHVFAPWSGDLAYWSQEQGWLKSQGPVVSGSKIFLERAVTPKGDFELRFLANLMLATSSNNYLELELEDSLKAVKLVVILGGTPDEVSVYLRGHSGDSLVIDGVDKRLASSSSNPIAVRLRLIDSLVSLDLGIQGDTNAWIREGSATLHPILPQTLRIRATYSASNATKFLLDAIYFGSPEIDTAAPCLVSFYDADSLTWVLHWSEALDTFAGTALDIHGDPLPLSWTKPSELQCRVDGSRKGPLTFRGFRDKAGNLMPDTVVSLQFRAYTFREIQISELFPDPTPSPGLPEIEWIELYHAGSFARQLKNFALADLSSSHLFPEYVLEPDSRLILTSSGNCGILAVYGNCLELGFSSSFLNNSGDRLILLNRQGDTLEWLEYSDLWHADALKRNGGFSLEKRDPLNPCLADAENFVTSPAFIGGSPGQLNAGDERLTDSVAPSIISFLLKGPSRIDLVLNEAIDTCKARFIFLQDSLLLRQIATSIYRVEWPVPLPDDARKIYSGTLHRLEDCSGNTSTQNIEFRYALPVIPEPHSLIFTEILFKPNSGQSRFIEVYNRSENAQSLAGSVLIHEEKQCFLNNRLLYPGEALILCRMEDTAYFPGLPYMAVTGMPVLSTKSGHLALKNVQGELLDAVHYSDTQFRSWPQKAMGYSLRRLDSTRSCSYPLDWQASEFYGGEPGVHSFVAINTETIIPKLQEIYPVSKHLLRLKFSAPIHSEPPDIRIPDAWGSPAGWELEDNTFRSWLLEWSDSLQEAIPYRIELTGLTGCNGEMMPAQVMEFRLPGKPEMLRINEILADPLGDDPDYIELYNAGLEAIDLKGMKLCNLDQDGTLNEQFPLTERGYLLMPGAYVVLTESNHRFPLLYDHFDESRVLVMKNFPSFPNAEGFVLVIDSLGNILDSVRYSENYHSTILTKTEGVSLERIDARIRSEGANNWTSAAASVHFGTPGRKNSQSREQGLAGKKYWNLYSPTFSPDGDGFEDIALLHYASLEPDSRVSIEVYGLSGILVYEWANNLPCGSSGSLKWEGIDGQGQLVPDGPYILRVTWTNSSGISKKERLVLVKASLLND